VRATHDRAVTDAEKRLFARLARQAVAETILLRVPAREGRAERQAKLELRYCPVRLRRPRRGFDPRDPDEVALSFFAFGEAAVRAAQRRRASRARIAMEAAARRHKPCRTPVGLTRPSRWRGQA
jgi:hypothetical protein